MIEKYVREHEHQVDRILEIFLGVLTWGMLLSPIWMGILYPKAVVFLLTFLTVYWFVIGFKHASGLIKGYRSYNKEIKVDWYGECQKLDFSSLPEKETLPPTLEDVRHFVLVPCVNEPKKVFEESLGAIMKQTLPTNQFVLVFTIEEKYAEQTRKTIEEVLGDDIAKFHKVLFYVHPRGIPGEAIGDGGANRAWGCSHAVEDLKKSGENIRNYIFSNMDADHIFHPQFYSRLAHLYLTSDKRDHYFYSSAVPLFDNNLWRVPLFMRIEANSVTMGVISNWGVSDGEFVKTFSAFSVSLQTLIDANYFNVSLGADDTLFYWRAFFARNGDFEGKAHFISYSADAVEGANYWDSFKSLYRQLLRWGWGAIDFRISIKEFLINKKVKTMKKVRWTMLHLKERVLATNTVFLITFGFSIVTLVNPAVKQSSFAYTLPTIMSMLLTATMVFLLPTSYYRLKIISPMPKGWPLWRKLLAILEGPLVVINLLTFSFVPWIHAQTKILLGQRMKDLYHTPKVR